MRVLDHAGTLRGSGNAICLWSTNTVGNELPTLRDLQTMSPPTTAVVLGHPQFPYLTGINASRSLTEAEGFGKHSLVLTLSNVNQPSGLTIYFEGVFNLKLGAIDSQSCVVIEIEDIRERQIEGACFRVIDSSANLFSFCCREYFVQSKRRGQVA